MKANVYLNGMGLVCASGHGAHQLFEQFRTGHTSVKRHVDCLWPTLPLGLVNFVLPKISGDQVHFKSRNNQLVLAASQQIESFIYDGVAQYGADRIGIVIGTSTSGIAESERMFRARANEEHSNKIEPYHYGVQEMSAPADFLCDYYGLEGPKFGVSTACTSGSKAMVSGKRLIEAGICDMVIAGGVDSLCELTVQGFSSLGAVSQDVCNPFSQNRDGINIGEAAALFVLSKESSKVRIAGVGESSDAHHISAPDPSGEGAQVAMEHALADARLEPHQIDYINLHGTATELNDIMEAKAVHQVFGDQVACSSTKPFTGHTLGAAGALEAGICWQLLVSNHGILPPQLWDKQYDMALAKLNFVEVQEAYDVSARPRRVLSNSFAFGGNNLAIILEASDVSS